MDLMKNHLYFTLLKKGIQKFQNIIELIKFYFIEVKYSFLIISFMI